MSLDDKDIDRIATLLVEKVRSSHHEFWIDPETHYQSHLALKQMLEDYDRARSLFWKVFITIIAAGAAVLSGIAFLKGGK